MVKQVIILAGGSGKRMRESIPKQFLELLGKPILMHTIERFYHTDQQMKIVVVLPQHQIDFWENLCAKHHFDIPHQIAIGGETRYHSVKNGLAILNGKAIIAVHDGVRPLIDKSTILTLFDIAKQYKTAIPTIDLIDSIREVYGKKSNSVERTKYKMVQTPQVFHSEILKKAYEQPFSPQFTDDASVVEAQGHSINIAQGNRNNLKITTPIDLKLAQIILENE